MFLAKMKSYSIISFLVLPAVILQAQGYVTEDAIDWYIKSRTENEDLDWKEDEPEDMIPTKLEDGHAKCNCKDACERLHVSRLPPVVRDEDNYLSYENFPVLCRDASSIMLAPKASPSSSKKYVCKQTFDCCRKCNHAFYKCVRLPGYTYGACMRGAYKCMCDCIDAKSYSELPYMPPTPAPTKPTVTTTGPPAIGPPTPKP